ncbi:MAG: hypothetical protein EOP10_16780 [Proteobacteria bacterium]|nr:MAG: hypothetical protein EOP10_16780 [Pseudomonadota bacterium]
MKVNRAAILLTGSMTALAVANALPIAQAQVKTEIKEDVQRIIPVKNVAPALLAYWINPAENPLPKSLIPGNSFPVGTIKGAKGEPVFVLPEGVKRVTPILAPQLGLLVVGTNEGIRSVEDTIAFLDRPLKQVEIEAQFVRISDEDLKAFGIEFGTNKATSFEMGFVRGNFQATLNKALAEMKAKVITAPRVTAINNMQAQLKWSGIGTPLPQVGGMHFRQESYGLAVVPTINNDDTVSLLLEPEILFSEDDLETRNHANGAKAIVNVRDGDTIVLKGFLRKTTVAPSKPSPDEMDNVVVFLTPRIVRKIEKANVS